MFRTGRAGEPVAESESEAVAVNLCQLIKRIRFGSFVSFIFP